MSGTASVPVQFAAAVTATGAQLDSNFDTIVAYVNNPTNRNNYAADGSATNTVILTFSPPVVGGYTSGLELTWKWGATNTGAVVMNANGLGNVSLVNPDGTALSAGQGVEGGVGKAVYDGTRFVYLTSFGTPASQAQMTAAANLVTFVSPGRAAFHPGVAKAVGWVNATNTGTFLADSAYNVTSVVNAGTGSYVLNWTNPMSTSLYPVIGVCDGAASGNNPFTFEVLNRTTSAATIIIKQGSTGTNRNFHFAVFGIFP